MPYKVVEVPGGWKVKKDQPGRPVYFSDKPMTREMAVKQMKAIYYNEFMKIKT